MGKVSKIFETDLLVIGGGVAGLSAAINGLRDQRVFLAVKTAHNSTALAQGGIAVALDKGDSPGQHLRDTLYAGAGLCDRRAVNILVRDAVPDIKELMSWGVYFDQQDGHLIFTKEAAHSRKRIVHAGDSTGQEVIKVLLKTLNRPNGNLNLQTGLVATEILIQQGCCIGAKFIDLKTRKQTAVLSKNTILATGGCVQVYKNNTNPESITGDGIALAYAAGAELQDMEFIQFHPTTLYLDEHTAGPAFLISEAVRGEGAVLRNVLRYRFMPDYHPLAELAPRDVVTRAIITEMHKTNSTHVLLDLSRVKINLPERFPLIYRYCKNKKINITKDLVPVVPAAHYTIGGIKTDNYGCTSLKHLYACGETAATGIHGANRLASNSLLEGLVFGKRAAVHALKNNPAKKYSGKVLTLDNLKLEINKNIRQEIKEIMWQNVGIIRDKQNMEIARKRLQAIDRKQNDLETNNLLTCALLITEAALKRKESRGTHFRSDYPKASLFWRKHLSLKKVG